MNDLTFVQKDTNLALEPLLVEKGKQHMFAGVTLVAKETRVDTLGTIGKKSKTHRSTVAKVKKILEKSPEKIKKECESGKRFYHVKEHLCSEVKKVG